jgi:hypothetical protein
MTSLNIKNQETVELVHELAAMTGTSLVAAVTLAVQDKIAQEKAARERSSQPPPVSRYDRLMAYAREFSKRAPKPIHSWDVDRLLYDEDGLPK